MSNETTPTPVALYARVSSDRQDVDLSVAAQLRALRDYADKNGYVVAREYIDEAESGRIADRPEFRKMLDEASKPEAPLRRFWSGNLAGSPASGNTPLPSSPCSGARASASSPSPSTPTTPPPAGSWRPSSSRWTNFTRKILPKKFAGECGRPHQEASGSPAGCPTAIRSAWCRTGPRNAPPWNPIPQPLPWSSAFSPWPSRAGASWTSPRPSTPRASPTPRGGSGPRTASTSSYETKPTPEPSSGASEGRIRPSRSGWTRRSTVSSPKPNSRGSTSECVHGLPGRPIPDVWEAPTCSAGWSGAGRATGRLAARTPRAGGTPTTSASPS